MFKIGMSLVLAVIAAFVIILAGFLSEVRVGTMLLRGTIGFVVAGLVGALFVTAFENREKPDLTETRERDEEEEMSYIPDDDDMAEQEHEAGEEEASEFKPLTAQGLDHVQPPEG
ncbi:MAG: hypothetical protein IKR28_04165 [Selenomonadaceae bacterium]|nr:hypothetical protein [Selenomonadaceae bacterium]